MEGTVDRRRAFSAAIEQELRSGELVFPTCMQATLKIRRALEDENAGLTAVSRAISLEPLLSVKLLRMANSAFYNPSGIEVSDVQRALMRVGLKSARVLALAVIGDQIATAQELAPVWRLADQLWRHSLDVASLSHSIAVQLDTFNPDTALLAGMVHAIGQFYLLARSRDFPELLEEQSELADFILYWDRRVGQAVLVALGTPEEIVDAIDTQDECTGAWPPRHLSDLLFLANTAAGTPNPFSTVSLEDQIARRQEAFRNVEPELINRMLDEARVRRAAAMAMLTA